MSPYIVMIIQKLKMLQIDDGDEGFAWEVLLDALNAKTIGSEHN